jgi:DNA helicase HerA-like ATPase
LKDKGQVLTWERLIKALLLEKFDKGERRRLMERLEQVRPFIDDSAEMKGLIQLGRLIIVDISDMWEDPEQSVLLCAVAMRILCMGEERRKAGACPLLVAIDEAHKFFIHPVLSRQLEYMVRERRHLGLNLIFGSQDPQSIPGEVLALMDVVGMLQHDSPDWIRYLARHISAFKGVRTKLTKKMAPGLMLMWAKKWCVLSEDWDPQELRLVLVRPRVTLHGGETRAPGAM